MLLIYNAMLSEGEVFIKCDLSCCYISWAAAALCISYLHLPPYQFVTISFIDSYALLITSHSVHSVQTNRDRRILFDGGLNNMN